MPAARAKDTIGPTKEQIAARLGGRRFAPVDTEFDGSDIPRDVYASPAARLQAQLNDTFAPPPTPESRVAPIVSLIAALAISGVLWAAAIVVFRAIF